MGSVLAGRTPLRSIAPKAIRYIKLGAAGAWEERALKLGELYFGRPTEPLDLIGKHDWEGVARYFREQGRSVGMASYMARENREFLTLGSDCLWITFSAGHLWWGFAGPKVKVLRGDGTAHGTRMRRIISGWRNTDIKGKPLHRDTLSTKLTQVASYRHTMCSVREADYLVRKINAVDEPIVARAAVVRHAMIAVAAEAIASLHWADFESLVDLIFGRTGWQRLSRVGGIQKDLDLELEQPTTRERVFVQVKSVAGQRELDAYLEKFGRGSWDRMFFVCHTPRGRLRARKRNVHVWTGDALASAAVRAGLFDWIIQKIA
jgi:hypothetical protein